jgi:hypothetical protein
MMGHVKKPLCHILELEDNMMQPPRAARDALFEMTIIAVMVLPAASVLAVLVGLTGWGLWGIEEGIMTCFIAWCATMAISQIAMRRLIHALIKEQSN